MKDKLLHFVTDQISNLQTELHIIKNLNAGKKSSGVCVRLNAGVFEIKY